MTTTHENRARAVLSEGEELLWTGSPDPKRWSWHILGPFCAILPLFLLLIGVVVFVAVQKESAKSEQLPYLLPLFGVVLVVGVVAGIFQNRRSAALVTYAVTNRRALVLVEKSGLFGREQVHDYAKGSLQFLHMTERGDGTGHLVFAPGRLRIKRKVYVSRGFVGVPHVKQVRDLIAQQDYAPPRREQAPWYVRLRAWF